MKPHAATARGTARNTLHLSPNVVPSAAGVPGTSPIQTRARGKTSRGIQSLVLASLAVVRFSHPAGAAEKDWKSLGMDFNTDANWQTAAGAATTFPGAGDVAYFKTAASAQPNLSASDSIAGLFFNTTAATGYDLTATNGAVLTLTGYSTTGTTGTSNSSAAAIRSDITSLTNTVDAPLILAPASATTSTFFQASGGTLVVNGSISGATSILSLKGGGTIQLNGQNTFGGGASIDTASETVVLGNNSALGGGTFTVSATSTLQAGGGARSIANGVVLGGNTTISGSNNIDFTNSVTSSGSASRTLTVSNSGSTTISGSVFLAPDNTTARGLIVSGTSPVLISGVIANNNAGNTLASPLSYSGSSTLTLTNANTYSGATTVSAGATLLASNGSGSATGSGAVTVSNGGTLGGAGGAINAGANSVTIGSAATGTGAATITGGTNGTVGMLTVTANSLAFNGATGSLATYGLDLSGGLADRLAITGNLDLSTTFDRLTLNVLAAPTLPRYQIITYTGTINGVFDDITSLPNGYSLDYSIAKEVDLVTTAVPEPSTWVAVLLGLGALGWSQRRRRQRARALPIVS